jgi:multiple sugar transport system ATP-binding protein
MADRIVIMKDGHIQQVGTPSEAYHNPVNTFVAQFIGAPSMNMLPGTLDETGLRLWHGARVPWNLASREASHEIILGVRPEDLTPVAEDQAMLNGTITVVEPLGSETLLYVDVDGIEVIASGPGRQAPRPGTLINLGAAAESLHLFDKSSGIALR